MVRGANSAPETALPTKLQTGLQFLTKDFLRFCMVDICWEGRCETQGAGNPREGTGAGDAEGRRRTAPAPGESVPVYFLAA